MFYFSLVSGTFQKVDHVPSVLSSQEKVCFLKKCCASPILRFILHLLSDRRQETLCSWYGGPFGVKIWNTRKFTESYNAAMGTKMNFTNISRALQACEHITMAAVRLWKRLKQGEYSFFPGYTGHGLPQIPLSAMPRDVPDQFPFERKGIVKKQPIASNHYGQISYRTPPSSESRSHHTRFQPYLPLCSAMPSPQLLSPAPSVSPQSYSSPETIPGFSTLSPGYVSLPCSILTPPPSENSSSFSESLNSSDSCLSQPYSPVYVEPSYDSYAEDAPTVEEQAPEETPELNKEAVQHQLDPSVLAEFLTPLEGLQTCFQPSAIPPAPFQAQATPPAPTAPWVMEPDSGPCATYLKHHSDLVEQDIFGNTSSVSGYDLSIDETSLLYH
ncbi:hypothetical protein COOONC_20939 [Cooperia oncophora]